MSINLGLLFILIFGILFLVSYYIQDPTLKLCYWLVVMLLAFSIFNVALAISYYVKLRNEPGIPGPRGPPGDKGSRGPRGVCSMSEQCNISDCLNKIVDTTSEIFPEITKDCLADLSKCGAAERSSARPIVSQIQQLTEKCKATTLDENDFMRRIRPIMTQLLDAQND